jgi:hypothetical protein
MTCGDEGVGSLLKSGDKAAAHSRLPLPLPLLLLVPLLLPLLLPPL